jgi:signal transduction histidine kinase
MNALLVEDNPTDARLIREFLGAAPARIWHLEHVGTLNAALDRLQREPFHVVLLDFGLPDSQGLDTLTQVQKAGGDCPVVALTGLDDQDFAMEVLRSGAQDYLVKGKFDGDLLVRTIHYAIERKSAEKEVRRLNAELLAANESLEHRVAARTAELAAAINELQASRTLALAEARLAGAAREQAEQAEAALRESHRLLEARVSERTTELSAANRALESEMTRRKEILRKLHEAEETERSRISRELHDRLGQDLTALKLGLKWLQQQCPFVLASPEPDASPQAEAPVPRPIGDTSPAADGKSDLPWTRERCPFAPSLQDGVIRLESLTGGLMREIHRLAWELHPAALDDLGLEAALRRYCTEWSEHGNVALDFHCDGLADRRLPLELETALYRVTQEALTNVLRHAQAKRVSVLLERRANHLSLIVEDNGVGFESAEVLEASSVRDKLGLLGMQERIRLAGGTLEIESAPARGTTVFVRVPLAAKEIKKEDHEKHPDSHRGRP